MPETYTCWKCGSPLPDLLLPLPRREECPRCRAELHVCRMCEFFDAAAPQQCREPVAEHVPDKSRANFCGYFRISPHAFTGSQDPTDDVRQDLEALFGDASSDGPAETEAASDAAQDALEDLFKK